MKSRVYILKLGLPHWAESLGKPKNTGVDGLSLLQGIFSTQESNWGLLHCRQILFLLSYQGSPLERVAITKRLVLVYVAITKMSTDGLMTK